MSWRLACIAAAAAGFMVAPAAIAHAQNGGEPFELVRSLQSLQDQIARGSARAHADQRVLMGRIAERFGAMSPERWKETRNQKAAVVFVLSGGSSGVLQRLLDSGVPIEIDEKLVKGVLAYGSGQKQKAAEQLHALDALSLDASIAGHVAYVQAELAAEKEPAKAFAYFEEARLLAPGTLIEEAALRRQTALAATDASNERYLALATRYLRRFPGSLYAGSFRNQFAAGLAAVTDASKPENLEGLSLALHTLDRGSRRDVCLVMAKVALDKGKVAMARYAATMAAQAAEEGSLELSRAKLLLAAVLVVTDDLEKGAEMLAGIDRARLPPEDDELVDAALAVAEQVRRPVGDAGQPPPEAEPAGNRSAAEVAEPALARARDAIARVDQILTGESQ